MQETCGKWRQKPVKALEVVQMETAKVILWCSRRTSNAAVRAELGIHSLKNGDRRKKAKVAVRLQEMGDTRLEAEWRTVQNGRRITEWDTVVEKLWK